MYGAAFATKSLYAIPFRRSSCIGQTTRGAGGHLKTHLLLLTIVQHLTILEDEKSLLPFPLLPAEGKFVQEASLLNHPALNAIIFG